MHGLDGAVTGRYYMVAQALAGYRFSGGGFTGVGESVIDPAKERTTCFDVRAGKTTGGWDTRLIEGLPETSKTTRTTHNTGETNISQ